MVRTMGSWQPRYRVPELRLALQAGFAEIASLSGAESVVKDRIFIRTNCRVVRFLVSAAPSNLTAQAIEARRTHGMQLRKRDSCIVTPGRPTTEIDSAGALP